jgi:RNA polymerase sigma-70 factor (ECF subfamily)
LAQKNRETEEATEDFEDFKNQFEKSPEEIMISEQEEKKL